MTKFIPAGDLKRHFNVTGHFYTLSVAGSEPLECRSVLEIMHKELDPPGEADAVFVMMNPGSSQPLVGTQHDIDSKQISNFKATTVPTKPDTTQYQVMRVMYCFGWKYVRVLNLSDLREAKSPQFAKRLKQLEPLALGGVHSVFAPQRSAELKRQLQRRAEGPVICAWGVGDFLEPLIQQAETALAGEPCVTGLPKPDQPGRYFHPLPTLQRDKVKWVSEMVKVLKARV
ncbi:DUF1643 domain-containing protein [Aeoliella sp. ICT_H6.2]|uniref:DUF1643 domain-containing protein n=1 Tax=Aeoliella straminimaris TaxID=2954799 RepID=A0A9X2FEU7_9BACT|nr:DUF1643 domain-containing protein [Aeoliella straminimaris]MCO6047409.1 DUF1643 domain-containing protein [Aeoliella straminimaris]